MELLTPFALLLAIWPAAVAANGCHELGHALAAVAVGGRVTSVGIGTGRPWFRGRVGGAVVYFAMGWGGGRVTVADLAFLSPGRRVAFFAGGMAGNLLMAAGTGALALAFVRSNPLVGGVMATFAFFNTAQALVSAIPADGFAGPNDGMQIWRELRGVQRHPASEFTFLAVRHRLAVAEADGDAGAEDAARDALALLWSELGDATEARHTMVARRPRPNTVSGNRALCRMMTLAYLGEPDEGLAAAYLPQLPPELAEGLQWTLDQYEGRHEALGARLGCVPPQGALRTAWCSARLACDLAGGDVDAVLTSFERWRDHPSDPIDRFVLGERTAGFLAARGAGAGSAEAARVAWGPGQDLLVELPPGAGRDRFQARLAALAELAGPIDLSS